MMKLSFVVVFLLCLKNLTLVSAKLFSTGGTGSNHGPAAWFGRLIKSKRFADEHRLEIPFPTSSLSLPSPKVNNNNNSGALIVKSVIDLVGSVSTAIIYYFLGRKLFQSFESTISTLTGPGSPVSSTQNIPPNVAKYINTLTPLDPYEIELLANVITPEDIDTMLIDIGGLVHTKASVNALLDDMVSKVHVKTGHNSTTLESTTTTTTVSSTMSYVSSTRSKKAINSLLQPIYGVLLFGPPGCGKSFLVRSLAKEKGIPILTISPSTLLRKYVGETSQLVKACFSLARKLQPCILFIDEMDSLFRARHEDDHSVDRNIKTEFMQLWDQLKDSQRRSFTGVQVTTSETTTTTTTTTPTSHIGLANGEKGTSATSTNTKIPTASTSLSVSQFPLVMVMGATNRPQDLDAAVQRRFEQSFLIGAPEEADREAIFKAVLRNTKLSENFDFGACARLTEGFTPSDIVALCKAAVRLPSRAMYKKASVNKEKAPASPRPLLLADIEETCSHMYPTAWQAQSFGQMQQQQQQQQQGYHPASSSNPPPPTFPSSSFFSPSPYGDNNYPDDEDDDE